MAIDGTRNDARVAIVTGVSRGYGKAVARALIADGWIVVGNGRDSDSLDQAASDLRAGNAFRTLSGDVSDDSHLAMLVDQANSAGRLELVVNNAGALGPTPLPALADLPTQAFGALLRVNTVAPLRLIQLALPTLAANSGAVVNVTSDAAVDAYAGWGGYGSTKAALEHLTNTFAVEAPDVRFYSLDPGDLLTDMARDAFPGEDLSERLAPEAAAPAVVGLAARTLPSGRYRAEDLA